MSVDGDMFQPRSPFLLKITGQVTVHFIDGSTLDGEVAAQDECSLFLAQADGPVMIPRGQIKFVKGQPGQAIETHGPPSAVELAKPAEVIPAAPAPVEPSPAEREPTQQFEAARIAEPAPVETPPAAPVEEPVQPAPPPPAEPAPPVPVSPWGEPEEDEESSTLVLEPEGRESGWRAPAAEPLPPFDQADQVAPWVISEEAAPPRPAADMYGGPGAAAELEEDDRTFVFEPQAEKMEEVAAQLVCTGGPHAGEVFKLTSGIGTMGRSPDSTYPLNRDKEVSRRHAIIGQEAGKYFIQDQNSLNGTFVNNELIKGSYYLKNGDVILVGLTTLEYHDKAA